MREAIGGTWLMGIVVVFIVLFTSYLALSVNYSKAFKVKNGVINIIEKNEGLNETEVSAYLNDIGYVVYGECDESISAEESAAGIFLQKGFEKSQSSTSAKNRYKYCITETSAKNSSNVNTLNKTYYKVTVFFRIDLPIIGNVFTFPVSGETNAIYYAKDRK